MLSRRLGLLACLAAGLFACKTTEPESETASAKSNASANAKAIVDNCKTSVREDPGTLCKVPSGPGRGPSNYLGSCVVVSKNPANDYIDLEVIDVSLGERNESGWQVRLKKIGDGHYKYDTVRSADPYSNAQRGSAVDYQESGKSVTISVYDSGYDDDVPVPESEAIYKGVCN